MDSVKLLRRVSADSKATDTDVVNFLTNLTADQLNWRPDKNTWSIAQEFHHMVLSNRQYVAIIEALISSTGPLGKEYAPGFWGRFLFKAVGPDSKMYAPVPKPLVPTTQPLDASIIDEYLSLQRRFDEAMEKVLDKDLNARFSSPFAKFVKLKLGDAVQIVALHNQRHVRKAKRVMELRGFSELATS